MSATIAPVIGEATLQELRKAVNGVFDFIQVDEDERNGAGTGER
jgi:hypothetical protein